MFINPWHWIDLANKLKEFPLYDPEIERDFNRRTLWFVISFIIISIAWGGGFLFLSRLISNANNLIFFLFVISYVILYAGLVCWSSHIIYKVLGNNKKKGEKQ